MIIIEFLLGVMAGTGSGLLILKRSGSATLPLKSNRVVKTTPLKSRAASRQTTKGRKVAHRRLNRGRARRATRSSSAVAQVLSQESAPQATVLSCPSCGLQAPESLMAEHFLGSPSHENNPPEILPIVSTVDAKTAATLSEEDSRDSLRNLLQMLVPPRAFGRRHEQRGVNPLTNLVQSTDGSRNSTVR